MPGKVVTPSSTTRPSTSIPSIVDLQASIYRFVEEINQGPKPFTWTAGPDKIIAIVKGGRQRDPLTSHPDDAMGMS